MNLSHQNAILKCGPNGKLPPSLNKMLLFLLPSSISELFDSCYISPDQWVCREPLDIYLEPLRSLAEASSVGFFLERWERIDQTKSASWDVREREGNRRKAWLCYLAAPAGTFMPGKISIREEKLIKAASLSPELKGQNWINANITQKVASEKLLSP